MLETGPESLLLLKRKIKKINTNNNSGSGSISTYLADKQTIKIDGNYKNSHHYLLIVIIT